MSYKESQQYKTADEVGKLIAEVTTEDVGYLSHAEGKDAWLENEDLTTEQMMRRVLNSLANKLAHKIAWRKMHELVKDE